MPITKLSSCGGIGNCIVFSIDKVLAMAIHYINIKGKEMQPPAPERKKVCALLTPNHDKKIQSDRLRSNRGTGTTRVGEGYTVGKWILH
ncbi:hypothetical protein [Nostoc sp.]